MTGPPIELEVRPYGPDSTPAEVEAIRSRVTRYSDDIVLWTDVPVPTTFSIDLCYDRVEELCRSEGYRWLIIDASVGARPDAAIRKRILDGFDKLDGQIVRAALVIAGRPLIRAAARFIKSALPIPMSVHSTIAEAEEALLRGQ